MKDHRDDGSDENTNEDEKNAENDDDDEWANIPNNERLFNNENTIVTPAYSHLLN